MIVLFDNYRAYYHMLGLQTPYVESHTIVDVCKKVTDGLETCLCTYVYIYLCLKRDIFSK